MEVATVVMTLILTLIYPSGKWEQEKRPVVVPICQTVDGQRVEDESCGLKACLKMGRERAAVLWGRFPGLTFLNQCVADNGESAKEGTTDAGGGHPALGWE